MSVWKAIYVSSRTFRVISFGTNHKFLIFGEWATSFQLFGQIFQQNRQNRLPCVRRKIVRKKNSIFKLFLILKEDFWTFWEKNSPACQNWTLRVQKFFNKKLDELERHSACPAEQLEEKCLGETKNSGILGNKREIAGNFYPTVDKNAITPRAHKNTLEKTKFSVQESNAEYIIYFWRKHSGLVAQRFVRIIKTGIYVSRRPFWKKLFPGWWCTFSNESFEKILACTKKFQVRHEGFLRIQWNISGNKFLVEIKILDLSKSKCKINGLQNRATFVGELAKLQTM